MYLFRGGLVKVSVYAVDQRSNKTALGCNLPTHSTWLMYWTSCPTSVCWCYHDHNVTIGGGGASQSRENALFSLATTQGKCFISHFSTEKWVLNRTGMYGRLQRSAILLDLWSTTPYRQEMVCILTWTISQRIWWSRSKGKRSRPQDWEMRFLGNSPLAVL